MIDVREHGLVPPAAPGRLAGPGNVGRLLDAAVAEEPDRLLLAGRRGRFTAKELDDRCEQAASALQQLGVAEGDRVAASLPNDVDIVVAFLGAMRCGAIWVGLNRPLAAPEKAYMLRDCAASVFLGDPEMAQQMIDTRRQELPTLRHVISVGTSDAGPDWANLLAEAPLKPSPVDLDPLTPAAIAYTSGTTGFPKGAVHSHHNLLLPGAVAAHRRVEQGSEDRAVLGVALPLTILNLMVLGPCSAYQSGGSIVTMDHIDAVGMAEWIAAEGITTFAAVPAMVHDLLTHPEVSDDMIESIESIGVGGADMPDAFRRLYQERFGRRVGTGYGLTEAPTGVTIEDVEAPAVPGTCGRALPQIAIHILDENETELGPGESGEVCVGPSTNGPFADVYRPMLGYWNRPDETAKALRGGLLHTGDLGYLDEDGNLFIKDRKHDIIIRGGANVYPAEVERVLHDVPGVAACAVVGCPDERLGERVMAFVELAPGATLDAETLRLHCDEYLARYKRPEEYVFVDSFERTPMGKIRKTVLREQLAPGSP